MYEYTYNRLHRIAQTEKGARLIVQAKTSYEENFSDKPIVALNYSYQKLYYQNGNRSKHETLYFERRKRLQLLQLIALADENYIALLEEILAAICDEFTWVLPAHNLIPEKKEYDYNVIDLFSAETGAYLAETAYIFQEKLSPDLCKRIRLSLQSKIVENYESRTCGWEGAANNWESVCSCGIGLVYLYAFPERFPLVKERILRGFESYLKGIDEEGYCSEGAAYWNYGFGFFSIFYDIYTQMTGVRPTILESKKVKNLVQYLSRTRMDGQVFLPFADGGAKKFSFEWQSLSAVKNLFHDDFDIPMRPNLVYGNSKVLGARLLNVIEKFPAKESKEITKKTQYYKNAQVFIFKNGNYAFAAKGGNNDEMHNHNDVGAFQIVKNQKRLICDIGAGEYTKDYFNDLRIRYGAEVFVCSSFAHSVPILGQNGQLYGKEYKAEVLRCSDTLFALELAEAYGGAVDSLSVTYEMLENRVRIRYVAKGLKESSITFRFVSDFKPTIEADRKTVRIEDLMTIENDQYFTPVVERKPYKGHLHITKAEKQNESQAPTDNNEEAYAIDYRATGKDVETEFNFIF